MSRPAGYLIWVHGAGQEQLSALDTASERLAEAGHTVKFCMTGPESEPSGAITSAPRIPDGLLSKWVPDLILWCERNIAHPALLRAQQRNIPTVLIDAGAQGQMPTSGWGLPGRLGRRLRQFTVIFTPTDDTNRQLRRLGAPQDTLRTVGLLRIPPEPAPHQTGIDISAQIGTRPAWCTAMVPGEELSQVIGAHKIASRHAHRLLLLLQLSREEAIDRCFQVLRRAHLRGVLMEPGVEIEETDQVIVCHASEPCPDWIGATSITYLGGSLTTGAALSPCLPARLGSAVMHGPYHGEFHEEIEGLLESQASVPVLHGADLAENLSALLGPDLAAQYAVAAWQTLVDAELATHTLIDLIVRLKTAQEGAA